MAAHARQRRHESLPARGVWIEIFHSWFGTAHGLSLPARGVWIEIPWPVPRRGCAARRSPQGECGLKLRGSVQLLLRGLSLPARGVWIEITYEQAAVGLVKASLPARGVWIEIGYGLP